MSLARVIDVSPYNGGSVMTRSNDVSVLHRASERVSAGAAAIALTCLTLLTVDARATESAGNPPSITVSYSDVAFGNSAGAANVYRKLKVAARKVCGLDNGSRSLELRVAARDCFEDALADAVRKIDRPALTAVHASNTRTLG
jgi:UrcA family protein